MSIGFSSGSGLSPQDLKVENQKRYKDVYAHELAHKSKAGSLGGGIVIDKDGSGLITGGHVDIKMPGLNKTKPELTIKQAQQVIDSAMAPSDPSAQDYKVAAEARSVLAMANDEAKNKQSGNKLDIMG
ncbi:MAG: putative metalloprotease CJM1_0395 family protein [Candidatus Gastranaerophilales bacterium]|nr:putative metalloprotease CJM1_0395 family protein [Candidatus Gastranaerophilales bacterium]